MRYQPALNFQLQCPYPLLMHTFPQHFNLKFPHMAIKLLSNTLQTVNHGLCSHGSLAPQSLIVRESFLSHSLGLGWLFEGCSDGGWGLGYVLHGLRRGKWWDACTKTRGCRCRKEIAATNKDQVNIARWSQHPLVLSFSAGLWKRRSFYAMACSGVGKLSKNLPIRRSPFKFDVSNETTPQIDIAYFKGCPRLAINDVHNTTKPAFARKNNASRPMKVHVFPCRLPSPQRYLLPPHQSTPINSTSMSLTWTYETPASLQNVVGVVMVLVSGVETLVDESGLNCLDTYLWIHNIGHNESKVPGTHTYVFR